MLGGAVRLTGRQRPAHASDRARATRSAWWTWQWRGWAPWRLDTAALALASAAVLVDVASAWVDTSIGTLGRIPVSPALPIAVLLAARLGAASLGCTRAAVHAWREVAAVMTVVLVGTVVTYSVDVGGPGQAVGLFVAAAGEELVYRLAVIVLVGALAARIAGREWRRVDRWGTGPGAVGLVGGALAFSALPGHVVQMQSLATAAPFASLAILLGWVVLRTGAIWPAIAAHALLNLTTITVTATEGPGALRLALAGATLCAVVVGADVAGRRTGRLRPIPSVIDLTAV